MEIILVISRSEDGRLSGSARPVVGSTEMSFSGTLELVAVLEQLLEHRLGSERR